MRLGQRFSLAMVVLGVSLGAAAQVHAVEVTIDDFSQADKTKIIFGTQVLVEVQGASKTATDFGQSGVVGGVRQLTVMATLIVGAGDNVTSGVDVGFGLCYNAGAVMANGTAELLYDRGGLGLENINMSHAQGIKVPVLLADTSSTDYTVRVTLIDDSLTSSTVSRTSNANCFTDPCVELMFPLAEFVGVNSKRIVSVKVLLDPGGANGDIFLGPIETYGTPDIETICDDGEDNDNNGLTDCQDPACEDFIKCRNTAPLLSVDMLAGLVALLSVVGAVGMLRTRRT